MNLPQDNEGLREIDKLIAELRSHMEADIDTWYDKTTTVPALYRLFQAEKTRLKAELIAKVRESLPEKRPDDATAPTEAVGNSSFNYAIDQVTAALDTLERGA